MSSFWDTIFQSPTKGETLPPPLNDIYSNSIGGAQGLDSTLIDEAADIVFPPLSPDPNSPNNLVNLVGKPAGFDLPPDQLSPSTFALWHTNYQQVYINSHKSDPNPPYDPATGVLTIGASTGTPIHVTLSSDQSKVYILEMLQIADFAKMTKADQQRIALTDTFINQLAPEFGLTGDPNVVAGLGSLLQQAYDDLNNLDPNKPNSHFVSDENKLIFKQELDNIKTRLDTQGVFSPTEINSAVKAIQDRFDRVAAFSKATAPENAEQDISASDTPKSQFLNVISLDNGEGIKSGLKNFMNAETQILAADNATLQLAQTGTLEGLTKHLDLPSLLAAFEMNANLKLQAISAANTEMIKQINDYLKTCNTIQEIINRTIASFDVTKSDEKRGLLGWHADPDDDNNHTPSYDPNTHKYGPEHTSILTLILGGDTDPPHGHTAPPLTPEQIKAINMFDDGNGGGTNARNPIEELFGIQRPTYDFFFEDRSSLNYFEKSFWDQAASSLGQMVQQASEQNQLIFNLINSEQKELTSHFQNATDALAKAQDLIGTIGRNIG